MSKKLKIKNLGDNVPLNEVKVRLPESIYESSSLPMYGIKTRNVYLLGWTMGDFFVKTSKKKKAQIYPMFWFVQPSDILEWEVVGGWQNES